MRDSIADIERITTVLHREQNFDRQFLNNLLEHKNATIEWMRNRQLEDLERIRQIYDGTIDTMMKEVELLERHLASYEEGVPTDEDAAAYNNAIASRAGNG